MKAAFHISSYVCLVLLSSSCARDRISYLSPGPVRSVNPDDWKELRIDMTRQEVISILGDSQAKKTEGPGTVTSNGVTTITPRVEYWQYNWSGGWFGDPHEKAYVVYFDEQGQVVSFRKPMQED